MTEGWGRPINQNSNEPTHWWTHKDRILCDQNSGMVYAGARTGSVKPDNACGSCLDRLSATFPTISIVAFRQLISDIDAGLVDPELDRLLDEEEAIEKRAQEIRDRPTNQNPRRDAYRHILNTVTSLENSGVGSENLILVVKDICQYQGK